MIPAPDIKYSDLLCHAFSLECQNFYTDRWFWCPAKTVDKPQRGHLSSTVVMKTHILWMERPGKGNTTEPYNIRPRNYGRIAVILLSSQTFSSARSLSRVRLFVTPWIPALQASLSITNSQRLLRLTSIESVMPSSHLILCRCLLLLPPIPPSIRVFSNESTLHMRWPKYWSFRFSISPSRLVGSPCSPRDSQDSSPTPQFKSINSSALSLLHSPNLTSMHDHRKNHSLD